MNIKLKILITCLITIFSTVSFSQSNQSLIEQLSPRAKYILAFDFIKSEARSPFPARKELGIPYGLDDTPRIVRSMMNDELGLSVSKPSGDYRSSENIWPYLFSELEGQEIDLLISRECFGQFFHWPSLNIDPFISYEKLEKLAHKKLAEQFSKHINADSEMRQVLEDSDYLFSTEKDLDLNQKFYEAWKAGRLERPTLMVPGGECSPGWAAFDVEVSFKRKTQRLFGIPTGDFKLCELDGVDPWDLIKCDGGQEILLSGETKNLQLFGSYLFKVITNDGTERLVGPVVINSNEKFSF